MNGSDISEYREKFNSVITYRKATRRKVWALFAVAILLVVTGNSATLVGAQVEDFEDNDIKIESSQYDGWNGDTSSTNSSLTVSSAVVLNGSYSGNFTTRNTNSDDTISASLRRGTQTPRRISILIRQQKDHNIEGDDTDIWIGHSANGRAFQLRLAGGDNSDGCDSQSRGCFASGDDNEGTGLKWFAGTTYLIEWRDINWNSHTYDLYINRVRVENDKPFDHKINGINMIKIQIDSASSGATNSLVFDRFTTYSTR